MSESDEHRALVLQVMAVLSALYPNATTIVDMQRAPGDEVPPAVGAFRPDVLLHAEAAMVIAEAKTDKDVDRKHTYEQVSSFIAHLERSTEGLFVLSVTGRRADLAKTVLRFVHLEMRPLRTRVAVFDQCDLWVLQPNGIAWDLVPIPPRS